MKKFLLLFCAAIAALNANAAVGDVFTIDNLTYTVLTEDTENTTGTVSVKGAEKLEGDIVIPALIENSGINYQITAIEKEGFAGMNGITSISLPEGLLTLNDYSFSALPLISEIKIPSSVTNIGTAAFLNCSSLASVTIPENVIQTGGGVFHGCTSLETVTIKCNTINNMFTGNNYIKKVILDENVQNIGSGAFSNCTNLTEINLPSTISVINSGTFNGCVNLTSITIPNSVTTISGGAFYGAGLTSIVIPQNVTQLGGSSFSSNPLSSVTIENVNISAQGAFGGVGTPDSPCLLIAPEGFNYEGNPENSYFSWAAGYFYVENYVRPNTFSINGLTYTIVDNEVERYVQTGTVNYSPVYSLATTVSVRATVPGSISGSISFEGAVNFCGAQYYVTEVENHGFENCPITNVTFPSVSKPVMFKIGDYAFANTQITSLVPPSYYDITDYPLGDGSIGAYAFQNTPLSSLAVGNYVTIDPTAFDGVGKNNPCKLIRKSTRNLEVEPSSESFVWKGGNFYIENFERSTFFIIPMNKKLDGSYYYSNRNGLSYSVIDEDSNTKTGTVAIAAWNMNDNVNFYLTGDIYIPSTIILDGYEYTVTEIKNSGFRYTNIEQVFGGDELVKIGDEAFGDGFMGLSVGTHDHNLEYFHFGPKIKYIGSQSFAHTNIKEAILPEGLEELGAECFNFCKELEKVYLPSTIKLDAGLNQLGNNYSHGYTFAGCDKLFDVTWANTTVQEQVSEFMFQSCPSIIQMWLPAGLKAIGSGSFMNMDNLRVIKIPNSVKYISWTSYSAFDQCPSLTHVTIPTYCEGAILGASIASMKELTLPKSLSKYTTTLGCKSIYVMGDKIPEGAFQSSNNQGITYYFKPSVYQENKDDVQWQKYDIDYKIPVTMTNSSGNPIEYKTLCRDFDVDLTHTNDNLPEGVEPLRAYLVEDVDGDLRMVFLNEIKYIPSRLKANVTDEDGNRYQGVDEYVGVVLRGTPGYTYYYEMGEHDYTQGAEGQWLLEDAMAYSGSTYEGNLMSGSANDDEYVYMTKENLENGDEIINYGLNAGKFKIYHKDGWLTYNKSYLQLPKYVSDAIEADTDAEGNANLTFVFQNADGTADKVSSVEFHRNCESDIFYNPYGQQVNANTKGIVINNGRKYVNK